MEEGKRCDDKARDKPLLASFSGNSVQRNRGRIDTRALAVIRWFGVGSFLLETSYDISLTGQTLC